MISVLLPFRNAAPTLHEAATSVLSDMTANDDELVLIDDGSTDESPQIAAALAASDPRVVLLRRDRSEGIAAALQFGLANACKSPFIARMDADDISLPGRFAAQANLLNENPKLGVAATQIEPFGAAGEGILHYANWQNALVTPDDHARSIFVESPVCHPSVMLRREALDAVGGYASGEFAEDYDLWLRLHAHDWQIAKVPRVFLRWRIHQRNTTWNDPRMSFESLRKLRARHLAAHLSKTTKPIAVWGAGMAGRRLMRELEAASEQKLRAAFFIDIDPKKIGRIARGVKILSLDEGVAKARAEQTLVIVAVAARGARDLVTAHLEAAGFANGTDFICAA